MWGIRGQATISLQGFTDVPQYKHIIVCKLHRDSREFLGLLGRWDRFNSNR